MRNNNKTKKKGRKVKTISKIYMRKKTSREVKVRNMRNKEK